MNYKATFCHPLQKDIIPLGAFIPSELMDRFNQIDWKAYLQKMDGVDEKNIFYSPSFEVTTDDGSQGLSISAVGDTSEFEFYLFYKRPKKIKTMFGLREHLKQDYITNVTGQTAQDVVITLEAFLKKDFNYVASKVGK